jgi:hypothetical protein
MTVESTDNRISHVGNGSTIQFPFPFGIFDSDDIIVRLATDGQDPDLLQRGVDYDVTLTDPEDLPSPGVVTIIGETPVPPTLSQTLTIVRTLPYTQEIEITDGGPMPAASLNEAFDRAVILMQQLRDQLMQTTMSLGEVVASDYFKLLAVSGNAAAARALLNAQELNDNLSAFAGLAGSNDKLPYFTGSGTMGLTNLTSFGRSLLDDQDAAEAQTTMGIDASGGTSWKQLTASMDFETTCLSPTTIKMLTNQTANIKDGTAIKLKMQGGYYVCQCVSYVSDVLTVSGVMLSTDSGALTELYYTSFSGMARDLQQVANKYYVADGEGTDNITATLDPAPPALVDKMHCRIIAAGANTGANVTFSPNAKTAKAIVKGNNQPLVIGDIPGQYYVMDLQYNMSLDKWVLLNPGVAMNVTDLSITAVKLVNEAVTQGKLKTSTTSVEINNSSGNYTLPGGQYGFYPQVKRTTSVDITVQIALNYTGSSFATIAYASASGGVSHIQQTYVTSSGEIYWVFILRDKTTKEIRSIWCAPDHPCFGNGGKPSQIAHPFGKILEGEELLVIHPTLEQVEAAERHCIKGDDEPDICMAEAFIDLYDIDEYSEPDWPSIPVTVCIPKMHSASGRMVKATAETLKTAPESTPIEVIKKVIPKPDGIVCRAFKLKKAKTT